MRTRRYTTITNIIFIAISLPLPAPNAEYFDSEIFWDIIIIIIIIIIISSLHKQLILHLFWISFTW